MTVIHRASHQESPINISADEADLFAQQTSGYT